jgi:trypsin
MDLVRRPRRLLAVLVASLTLTMAMAMPAAAVTHGDLDGNAHPYVGLMVAQDEDGVPLWRCSGTLMSPTVFLTAGHCTEDPAAHVEIWFSAGPVPLGSGYPAATPGDPCDGITGYPCTGDVGGTPFTHPQYNPDAFFLFDLGVVVLDEAFASPNGVYGALPELNSLDSLKPGPRSKFTSVGYGLQAAFPDAAAWKNEGTRIRMVAHPQLLQINVPGFTGDYSLLLSNNARTGGTCFGDSGGPNFLADSNVVAGVTSFGINPTCGGTGGVYRVDRADDLEWLATFGITP